MRGDSEKSFMIILLGGLKYPARKNTYNFIPVTQLPHINLSLLMAFTIKSTKIKTKKSTIL